MKKMMSIKDLNLLEILCIPIVQKGEGIRKEVKKQNDQHEANRQFIVKENE